MKNKEKVVIVHDITWESAKQTTAHHMMKTSLNEGENCLQNLHHAKVHTGWCNALKPKLNIIKKNYVILN